MKFSPSAISGGESEWVWYQMIRANTVSSVCCFGGRWRREELLTVGETRWPRRNQIHRLTELRYIDGLRRLETMEVSTVGPSEHRPTPPEEQFGIGMYNYGGGLY